MNFSIEQDPVAARADSLAELIVTGKLTDAETVAQIDALLPAIRESVETHRDQCSKQSDVVRAWLADRPEHPMRTLDDITIALFPGVERAAVIAAWRQQLKQAAIAIRKLIADDPGLQGEWLYYFDLIDGRGAGRPYLRVEQMRDCFREIAKTASILLTRPRDVRLNKHASLLTDDFSTRRPGWKTFGTDFLVSEGKLNIHGMGVTVWCEQDFTDACIAFDFQPVTASGESFGTLFAFPGAPNGTHDYSISAGAMNLYNHGINTYHVSLCRGNSGRTNLRRAGNGLKLLSTVEPDACQELGRTYRVELIKFGNSVQVIVDGKLIHAFVDAGCYGAPPRRGRFGIRHFGGAGTFHTRYGNFEITELRANS